MLDTPASLGRYFSDTECDNLLDDVTVIHCAVMEDMDTGEVHSYEPHQIGEFLERYKNASLIVGHHWLGYDEKVIEKLHGVKSDAEVIDTLCLARLVHSDIKSGDFPRAKEWKLYKQKKEEWEEANPGQEYPYKAPPEFPGQFCGSHSLEAWGYRIGSERKGDYAKDMKDQGLDPWKSWNPAMQSYMLQDATVTKAVYNRLMAKEPTKLSIDLEMNAQRVCVLMEESGWPFDVPKAQELYATLQQKRHELETALVEAFPPWRVRLEDFIPKRNNKTQGYVAGVPVERWETKEFNPGSRQDIADRLISKYGWKPAEFTEGGQAKIDETTLSPLPYPEAKLLSDFFLVQKRIGQLGEGPQAWLSKVKNGKIHTRYNSNGAVTGRSTHSSPNIAQVPSVGKLYGKECRELFHVPKEWGTQLGADQSGLELRCLASFMAAFDGGAYRDIVLNGDIHWSNAKALFQLPDSLDYDPENKEHKSFRNIAKTFIYAYLYGAGDAKLGSIIGKGRQAGVQLRARFLKTFPALAKLINAVKTAAKKGWLKGLDGRVIPVRSEHAALNSLLQSAGALVCKQWLVLVKEGCDKAGFKYGWDGDYTILGHVHDELAIAVRNDHVPAMTHILKDAGERAGDIFPSWDCPTNVDVKAGHNWAETH